jgi:hypothetical protein
VRPRSLDRAGRTWLVDYSFAELAASRRQMDLDVAELLASLALLVGPDRAVASAAAVIGTADLAAAVPVLQPLPCPPPPGAISPPARAC